MRLWQLLLAGGAISFVSVKLRCHEIYVCRPLWQSTLLYTAGEIPTCNNIVDRANLSSCGIAGVSREGSNHRGTEVFLLYM